MEHWQLNLALAPKPTDTQLNIPGADSMNQRKKKRVKKTTKGGKQMQDQLKPNTPVKPRHEKFIS